MDKPQNRVKTGESSDEVASGSQNILQVFKLHEKSLRHYISSFFIRPQDIEDISQETFLRTFKSHLKEEVHKPKSFMYRVAKNLIMSEFRRSSYKLTDYIEDISPSAMPIDVSNVEENIEAQEKLGWFCEALATLPEKTRRIMVMRKVYGLTVKEIAARMDMPVSTINWNLAKGITHCDNWVEQHENNEVSPATKTFTEVKAQGEQKVVSPADDGRQEQ